MGRYDNRNRRRNSNTSPPEKYTPKPPPQPSPEPDRSPRHMPQDEAEVAFTRIEYMIDDQERHLCRYVIVTTWREVPSVDSSTDDGTEPANG